MDFTVVIPARYASTRLPAKPLCDIAGKPMIQRVYEQAGKCSATQVIIATDDQRVADVVKEFGGRVCLTSPTHESGTDRLEEVSQHLGLSTDDIVVNVQGDEPLIPPDVIDQVAKNLAAFPAASVSTLSEPIRSAEDFANPNVVKVVADREGMALYFSRAAMPWPRDVDWQNSEDFSAVAGLARRHIGIYGYRVGLLHQFVEWPVAPLETCERLEQLRVLWNGHRIHVADALVEVPPGVDTEADLNRVRTLFAENGW